MRDDLNKIEEVIGISLWFWYLSVHHISYSGELVAAENVQRAEDLWVSRAGARCPRGFTVFFKMTYL